LTASITSTVSYRGWRILAKVLATFRTWRILTRVLATPRAWRLLTSASAAIWLGRILTGASAAFRARRLYPTRLHNRSIFLAQRAGRVFSVFSTRRVLNGELQWLWSTHANYYYDWIAIAKYILVDGLVQC
jgi:hypothetical protein